MNLKYKLISFVTSLALIGTMSANALAEKPSKSAAVAQPNITLTTSTPNIQLGQSVDITLSIDAQKEGFAGLNAVVGCAQAGLTPDTVRSDLTCPPGFTTFFLPQKNGSTFSGLVLGGTTVQKVKLESAAVYTFTAEKVGTYTVSVSGDYSDTSGNSTSYSAVSPLTITVSAKALTTSVNNSAKLSGPYGEAPSTLATHITKDMVSFSDNGEVVSVDGTWTYAGEAGSYPTVDTQKAAFLFTPDDQAQYAPLTVEIPVEITPKKLTAELSVANASKQYDGTKKLPDGNLAVKLNGSVSSDKLTATIQGTPEYDSANVGESIAIKATYKVSGSNLGCYTLGDQTLSADAEYTAEASGSITPYTGVVTVSENFDTRSYNGTDQPLNANELTLKDSYGNKLTAGTDYEVTYPGGCRGSGDKDTTVSYKLTGLNNYAGCTFAGGKGSFEIKQLPMPVATGKLGDVTVDYNTPFEIKTDAIRLSDSNGKDITSAGDLKLRYKAEGGEWTDVKQDLLPGTYTVGVYFDSHDKNAYASGMLNGITAQLVINKVAGSGTVTMEDYTYGDKTPAPVPTSTTNGTADVSYRYTGDNYDSDKAPVNAGKYTVTATFVDANGIYNEATATDSFTVSPKKLTDNDVKFSSAEFTYNGEVQKPELQTSLTAEDYSAVYSDESSTIAGSYTVTVTGKGNYTGSVACTYTIKQANGSGSVTMADYTYGDKAPAPVATSATNGTTGVSYTYEGRDGTTYAKSETAPTDAGSYTVTASFEESANATVCTATANFTVHPKGLVADNFALSDTEFTYNGSEQKPTVSVTDGCKLAKDTDYTVTYPEASTNAGSYKVTVTGKGNYTGIVELSYKINPAVYTLPTGAKIVTELSEYPINIYGGQPLSHIGLKAEGLPEGAQFGWKAGDTKLATSAGDPVSYDVTVDPNDPNYSPVTTSVSVTLTDTVTAADSKEGITGQLSTVAASISKTASEKGKLSAGASADIAKLTLSGKLTPKEQDDLKSAHLSDTALLDALDKSAENVTVSTQLNKGDKSALTGLAITTGGKAALGESSGTATYTAKDITPEKPADGQLIEVELSLGSGQQPAVPVLVNLSFHAKNADPNGKFQVVHKHTEADASKNFTTQYDCRSVSKSGDTVTVQFLAASFSSFSIQYTAPASGGSSSPSATPMPDEPQPQPTATPALTASETTWLGGYGALLNAKSGTALSLDVTACEYLPGYIITGVQKSGVTLNLSTPAGKLCLSPAVAKAMNGSYNYTFADALAIAGKVAAAAKPAASPAPVKDPTAASPTPAPTPVPTAAPQPTQAPAPQPEAEPQEKSHSLLPMVAAVLVAAALLAGGYLAYNSASRRKAMRDVYAPSKKVKLNQNQNNGQGRK